MKHHQYHSILLRLFVLVGYAALSLYDNVNCVNAKKLSPFYDYRVKVAATRATSIKEDTVENENEADTTNKQQQQITRRRNLRRRRRDSEVEESTSRSHSSSQQHKDEDEDERERELARNYGYNNNNNYSYDNDDNGYVNSHYTTNAHKGGSNNNYYPEDYRHGNGRGVINWCNSFYTKHYKDGKKSKHNKYGKYNKYNKGGYYAKHDKKGGYIYRCNDDYDDDNYMYNQNNQNHQNQNNQHHHEEGATDTDASYDYANDDYDHKNDDYDSNDNDDDNYEDPNYVDNPLPPSPHPPKDFLRFIMVREEAGTPNTDKDFGVGDTLALNGQIYYWEDYDAQIISDEANGSFVALCTGINTKDDLLCKYEIVLGGLQHHQLSMSTSATSTADYDSNDSSSPTGIGAFIANGPNYQSENYMIITGTEFEFSNYNGGTLVTTEDLINPYLYADLYLL